MSTATAPRFNATRKKGGGPLTVHRVPIFVETEKAVGKGEAREVKQFDAAWIEKAVAKAKAQEKENGYLPPLHVRHHGEGKDVVAAGHFRVTGTEQIQFNGTTRTAVMADLVITNPEVEAEVRASRFPYRSVEIHKVDDPAFDSLALLDDEVPHLRLPMLEVGDVAEAAFRGGGVAVFRAGAQAMVQFAFGKDDEKPKDASGGKDSKGSKDASGSKDPKASGQPRTQVPARNDPQDDETVIGEGGAAPADTGETPIEPTTPDAKSIVEAIKSGAISVADLQAIIAAIHERSDAGSDQPDGEQGIGNKPPGKPAKAPVPGTAMQSTTKETMTTETMKSASEDAAVKMAALQGEVEALKAKDAIRDAADKRRDDVAAAMKKLAGRPLGSDLETRLVKFHTDCGGKPEVFGAYVDAMANGAPPTSGGSGGSAATMGTDAPPAVAMKYSAAGPNAIEKATTFAKQWEQQRDAGLSLSEERYVEIHMVRAGFKAPAKQSA